MPPVLDGQWWLLVVGAFCAGLAKGGLGGFGFVPIIILATVYPAKISTGVLLVQLICADLIAVWVFRRHADWQQLRRVIGPALVGVMCGAVLLGLVPERLFRPILGGMILLLIVVQLLRTRMRCWVETPSRSPLFAWSMGGLAGITTMLANAAGPVMALYFLALRLPKMAFVGTGAWFFFVLNLCKVPFSVGLGVMPLWSLTLAVIVSPAIAVGVVAGRWVVSRLPQAIFEWLVLAFAIVGGAKLIAG